ncbi:MULTISPECIES: DUF4097 family beta strand repeat-containing protein [Streptomyces]|uniref:DUF4097 family beta strand repeat-containing protein n=1 Tax=Streptomyces TaxID=1883 RepID=UPI001E327FBA|nr:MULTISPECIES: DUF4097 family beta strand repeat-containing protein [Streptomyces]UFQ18560.1 DUF4097 domain-containing protein [Streptomyces huasconensis]WCL88175.1 DUF4097 family beta strand repeat-containing protein [Streptomyces sp. JCM 35825]
MATRKNRWILAVGLTVLVVIAGTGAWLVTKALPAHEKYSSTHTANAASGTLLRVDTRGGVTLHAGRGSKIHVTATGDYADTPPKVSVKSSDKTTTVTGSCGDDCSLNLDITLPAALAAEVSSGPGQITGSDLTGRLALTTDAGAIDLTGPRGPLVLHTSSGQVDVKNARPTAFEARTEQGEVRATFATAPTTTDVTTDRGSVDLALPPHAGYYIQAQSKTGTPHITLPWKRDGKHTVTVHTNEGGVEIH